MPAALSASSVISLDVELAEHDMSVSKYPRLTAMNPSPLDSEGHPSTLPLGADYQHQWLTVHRIHIPADQSFEISRDLDG